MPYIPNYVCRTYRIMYAVHTELCMPYIPNYDRLAYYLRIVMMHTELWHTFLNMGSKTRFDPELDDMLVRTDFLDYDNFVKLNGNKEIIHLIIVLFWVMNSEI